MSTRGKTYPLYGPEEQTFAELVEVTGSVLGRKLSYQKVPFAAMFAGFSSGPSQPNRNDSFSGYSESVETDANGETFLEQHLREASLDHHNGLFAGTNDLIERITGVAPMSVETFLDCHRSIFESFAGGPRA